MIAARGLEVSALAQRQGYLLVNTGAGLYWLVDDNKGSGSQRHRRHAEFFIGPGMGVS